MKNSADTKLFERQALLRKEIEHTKRLFPDQRRQKKRKCIEKRLKRLANDYNDLMLDIQAENPQLASFVSVVPLKAEKFIADLDEGVVLFGLLYPSR